MSSSQGLSAGSGLLAGSGSGGGPSVTGGGPEGLKVGHIQLTEPPGRVDVITVPVLGGVVVVGAAPPPSVVLPPAAGPLSGPFGHHPGGAGQVARGF